MTTIEVIALSVCVMFAFAIGSILGSASEFWALLDFGPSYKLTRVSSDGKTVRALVRSRRGEERVFVYRYGRGWGPDAGFGDIDCLPHLRRAHRIAQWHELDGIRPWENVYWEPFDVGDKEAK